MPVLSPPPILPSHLTGYTAGSLGIRTHVHSVSCVRYVPRDALAKGRTRKRDDELLGRLGATRATESPSGGSRLAVDSFDEKVLGVAAWRPHLLGDEALGNLPERIQRLHRFLVSVLCQVVDQLARAPAPGGREGGEITAARGRTASRAPERGARALERTPMGLLEGPFLPPRKWDLESRGLRLVVRPTVSPLLNTATTRVRDGRVRDVLLFQRALRQPLAVHVRALLPLDQKLAPPPPGRRRALRPLRAPLPPSLVAPAENRFHLRRPCRRR
eukprot:831580-Prorocentrum_minimum.AAC.3